MIAKQPYPVMGFNTFDGYGWSVTEEEFRRNVIFCDKELKPYGYTYMTLDFMWSTPGRDNRDNPDQNEDFTPWRNMDRYGRLIPAPDRFPSSVAQLSLKPLADLVHTRGMKFGLHVMCGVPRQAVAARCPIKGTNITCDRIISQTDPCCTWNNEMYPIDFEREGAQEYVNSLVELYTAWEVDLLKVDDLSFPYRKAAVEAYGKAIAASPREIVFSTSPGATPPEQGNHVAQWANMWRISPDFWDTWEALREQMDLFETWRPYRHPGAYPDGDMFPVSQLSNYGPWEAPRYSNFTYWEKRTFLSVWALENSPIILGGDLTAIDTPTLRLLQNETIAVLDKEARNAAFVQKDGPVWRLEAEIAGQPGLRAVALVNVSDQVQSAAAPENAILNVWGNTVRFLAAHDTALYILEK